jgi:hypothetical protein
MYSYVRRLLSVFDLIVPSSTTYDWISSFIHAWETRYRRNKQPARLDLIRTVLCYISELQSEIQQRETETNELRKPIDHDGRIVQNMASTGRNGWCGACSSTEKLPLRGQVSRKQHRSASAAGYMHGCWIQQRTWERVIHGFHASRANLHFISLSWEVDIHTYVHI